MLKRPSARRRTRGEGTAELPLVPIMDAFVTLIAFLLMVTSLLSVTLIDTPVPIVSAEPPSKERPLALTVTIQEDMLKIESDTRLIPSQQIPRVEAGYDLEKFHNALLEIKKKFPAEKQVVFKPSGVVKYDDIIQLMDASRQFAKTDETLYVKGEGGVDKVETNLFPNVVFGNIISGM